MSSPIQFFIPCVPFNTTHHHKMIVRMGKFSKLVDKPELTLAINTYESLLIGHQPASPFRGAAHLTLAFRFPFLKSCPKSELIEGYPKVSRPDCSNLAKTFEDCLVRMRFLEDDNQVAKLTVDKVYSHTPGVGICIKAYLGTVKQNALPLLQA